MWTNPQFSKDLFTYATVTYTKEIINYKLNCLWLVPDLVS